MKLIVAWVAALWGLVVTGCMNDDTAGDGRPLVVATTTMVADLARQIGGERVEVRGLMAPGVDPHSFVPRLSDTALLDKAALVIYSGLHLEGRFQTTLEAMAGRGRPVVAASSTVPEDRLLVPQEGFEGTKDPHFWGDPELWLLAVDAVIGGLEKIDPEGTEYYRERARAYRSELTDLASWAKERMERVPPERRVLATSHDAFFYFGRAYGFEVRGLQGVSTATEAGIRDRTRLVEFLRKRGVRTVFSETSINAKGIAAVAAEAGARVSTQALYSDALGEPGDTFELEGRRFDRGTYIGMMVHNLNAIAEELAE
jgi:manganese/zinc/iron transport system substrate-binding protein